MIRLFIFLFVLSIPREVLSNSSQELKFKYGIRALKSLRHLLDFFESDAENLNLDGVYGLRICQGQLQAFEHRKEHLISSLLNQIERIANRSLAKIELNSPSYLHRFALLVHESFSIDYQRRTIDRTLIENGEQTDDFDEENSDECFGELFGSNEHNNSRKCSVSQSCVDMMTSSRVKGYRLTHQLLWILAAKNIGCLKKKVQYYEEYFCANIYVDADYNLKNNLNQDLFLEQLLLCSMIGFEDFLRYDWFHTIISWQEPNSGCFGSDSEAKRIFRRHLLYDQDMRDGCLSHMSGLASGLLGVYTRIFLQ